MFKKILGIIVAVMFIAVMVQAQSSIVIMDTATHHVIHLTNISDTSTNETDVVKVDRSGLTAKDGGEPASLDLEQVEWNMQGYTYIGLEWDQPTTDDQMVVLNGSGYKDFRGVDKGIFNIRRTSGLQDPRDAVGTGDVVLTTSGNASGNTYDITLWLLKTSD